MRSFDFEDRIRIRQPIGEVFAFFADARNLERLTPPWLRFEILSPGPIVMAVGTLIDYRLRIHGVPVRWRSRITEWNAPLAFTDEQVWGPYRRWVHRHEFAADGDCTVVTDRVSYAVPGGRLVQRFIVEPDLRRIWSYRRHALAEILREP